MTTTASTETERSTNGTGPGAKATDASAQKKSKKKLIIIGLVVVLALGGLVAKGKFLKPHYRPGQKVPDGQVYSLGSLTMNTSDAHIVQATIDLQLTAAANAKTVAEDQPQLADAAITDVGAQTYTGLLGDSGRAALKSELLSSFQKVLGASEGAQQVDAIYFSAFVLQ
ncbi:MAG TPA: flagellar basal body-associated FliL family protein [Acidimicrobiales bacterium]|nr:flagellar basal body-associated FliL family protein [Acidimicrobiales bacterium]